MQLSLFSSMIFTERASIPSLGILFFLNITKHDDIPVTLTLPVLGYCGLQLTELANRCHGFPARRESGAAAGGGTMRPLYRCGFQPVCRVLFRSNLHLTFRLMALLSPFPR